MSHSRRDGNIILVSLAVFVFFVVSSIWVDPASDAASTDGIDRSGTMEATVLDDHKTGVLARP